MGPAIMPSGDIEADFEIFRAFYADKFGIHPEKGGTVALSPQDKRRMSRASKNEES
jgi:hypothetical protein